MEPRKTPLYKKHLECKGRIVDFSGWALPVYYTSMLKEAEQVRGACGMFDASHMGEIQIKGAKALDFLQKLTSNNISLIKPGQMQYNLFINNDGGIIDDFMCYRQRDGLLCVVNSSNKDEVLAWLEENNNEDVEIIDKSQDIALISVQGPNSVSVIEKVFGKKSSSLDYMFFIEESIDNRKVLISRSGYTGEDGFEIYALSDDASHWWDALIRDGKDFDLMPCGLGSRDILRIEAGYPLYGHEINKEISPYEASLGWAVKTDKEYIGKDKIFEIKNKGLKVKRIGFVMEDKAPPRQGYGIYSNEERIGEVTSGTFSPNIKKFIGMASIKCKFAQQTGADIEIKIRNKFYKARIAKYPFVKINTKQKKQGVSKC